MEKFQCWPRASTRTGEAEGTLWRGVTGLDPQVTLGGASSASQLDGESQKWYLLAPGQPGRR